MPNLSDDFKNEALRAGLARCPLQQCGNLLVKLLLFHQHSDGPKRSRPWHTHSHSELSLIRRGQALYKIGKNENWRRAGDWVFIPPGISHQRIVGEEPCSIDGYWLQFLPSGKDGQAQWRALLKSAEALGYGQRSSLRTEQAAAEIDQEISGNLPFRQQRINRLVLDLLTLMLRDSFPENFSLTQPPQVTHSGSHQHLLERALGLIEENLSSELRIKVLAGQLEISERLLNTIFVSQIGMSAGAYLQLQRLQRGLVLLQSHPRLKINEVSRQVGFQDPYYFTKSFTKQFGLNPTEIRKRFS